METIFVTKDETLCDEDSIESYVNVLNGIIYHLEKKGYVEGERNEMIVNMCVAANMLGIDPYLMLDRLKAYRLINDKDDDDLPITRVNRVMNYTNRFSWDWMIDASWYDSHGAKHAHELYNLKIEID